MKHNIKCGRFHYFLTCDWSDVTGSALSLVDNDEPSNPGLHHFQLITLPNYECVYEKLISPSQFRPNISFSIFPP